jgi:putative glutamine amidotransferase
MVDGVLVSGGDDVDPSSYGAEDTASTRVSRAADVFETAVVGACRDQGKPLLAICRGLQLLNVALGGSLVQEVTSAGGVHELIDSDHDATSSRRHVVRLEPDSILAGIYGSREAKVNTMHHQGVDRLAEELLVEGTTEDGLVEAARCQGDWWALGVQWHPERMDGDHQAIFTEFRRAIEASQV